MPWEHGRVLFPRRAMEQHVEVPVKFTVKLANGANYTVLQPCAAWGAEDLFGMALRERQRRPRSAVIRGVVG